MNRPQITEQCNENGQTDGGFGRCDGQNEENKDLTRSVPEIMGEGDEVHIDGEQDQLDGHQQNDQILAIKEDPDDTDGKQYRPENQIMRQRKR